MIRKFKSNDIDRVMNIWLNTNIDSHNFIDRKYWESNYKLVKELLPQSNIYVYEEDEYIIGFVGVTNGYIEGIFIEYNMQSKGVGKNLLDYIKKDYNNLSLSVYEKNQKAIKFYKRENFSIIDSKIEGNTNELEYIMRFEK